METKKIKPGVEYATCGGILVVPEGPVERVWYEKKTRNPDKTTTTTIERIEQLDPWGGCVVDGNRLKVRDLSIKVKRYDVDRDGKRIEKTGRPSLWDPADIKGTWSEYLALHARRLRYEHDKKARLEEIDTLQQRIEDAVSGRLDYAGVKYEERRIFSREKIVRDAGERTSVYVSTCEPDDGPYVLPEPLGVRVEFFVPASEIPGFIKRVQSMKKRTP